MAYDLFISHSWTYADAYDRLIKKLNLRPRFDYHNYSVPKDDPVHTSGTDHALRAEIKNKIQLTQVVVILAGVYATHSKWINIEIDIAQTGFLTSTPILAVEPWGSELTSQPVKDAANKVVGWNIDSIISGIRELAP
jgi:hypothetical protein